MIETASDKGGVYTADMLFRLTKQTNSPHGQPTAP